MTTREQRCETCRYSTFEGEVDFIDWCGEWAAKEEKDG